MEDVIIGSSPRSGTGICASRTTGHERREVKDAVGEAEEPWSKYMLRLNGPLLVSLGTYLRTLVESRPVFHLHPTSDQPTLLRRFQG